MITAKAEVDGPCCVGAYVMTGLRKGYPPSSSDIRLEFCAGFEQHMFHDSKTIAFLDEKVAHVLVPFRIDVPSSFVTSFANGCKNTQFPPTPGRRTGIDHRRSSRWVF